eukprot:CAMPEP_0170299976 /NCGR_PEP_ID=MMETSP0116_2-20130129/50203_1 /TAXON_ID=400756 /ORGANISM="Durinskia baltica, Strain CSIRO CS-38" /LENGTH=57 /DNA_ID=CAMNT_0010551709 /DNA_START=96 /DNA_END=266 /DNA_ORIENTATION=-
MHAPCRLLWTKTVNAAAMRAADAASLHEQAGRCDSWCSLHAGGAQVMASVQARRWFL